MNSGKQRFHGPDILRGGACSAIVFFHLYLISGVKFSSNIWMIVSQFGMAVPLFYIISAFSIYYNYFNKINTLEDIGYFIKRRFFRLAPLFYFMLIIHIIISKYFFNNIFSSLDLLGSILFIYPMIPHMQEGIVWASWSIGLEWLFYLVFPVILVFLRDKKLLVFIFTLIFIYIHVLILNRSADKEFYMNFITQLCFFLEGILLAQCVSLIKQGVKQHFYIILFFNIIMVIIYFVYLNSIINSTIFYCLLFCCLMCNSLTDIPRWLDNVVTRFVGVRSYSIYLLHPVVIFIYSKMNFYIWICYWGGLGWKSFIICGTITLITVYAISIYTYRFIERPGMAMFKFLR